MRDIREFALIGGRIADGEVVGIHVDLARSQSMLCIRLVVLIHSDQSIRWRIGNVHVVAVPARRHLFAHLHKGLLRNGPARTRRVLCLYGPGFLIYFQESLPMLSYGEYPLKQGLNHDHRLSRCSLLASKGALKSPPFALHSQATP